jgi:hypothetical protein
MAGQVMRRVLATSSSEGLVSSGGFPVSRADRLSPAKISFIERFCLQNHIA